MHSTDPIADMLSRIRNSLLVNKNELEIPYSKIKEQIAQILKDQNFIDSVAVSGEGKDKKIHIVLHSELAAPRITEITRVSKPGSRVYAGTKNVPTIKNGRGIVLVSTSKGVMTGTEARQLKVGGEVLCSIY